MTAPYAAFQRRGEPPPIVAAIDLGSNTALMSVLLGDEVDRRRLRVLEELHVVTGLGKNRRPDGSLALDGRSRALGALRHFATRLDVIGVRPEAVVGAATAAVREATGGSAFLDEVEATLGLTLEGITGQEEAELVALAQERSFPGRLPLRVVDFGGGSTEVALRQRGMTAWKASMPTGSVKLTERHGSNERALRAAVDQALVGLPSDRERATLVGVAGTVTTGLQLARGIELWDPDMVHGQSLRRATVDSLITRLASMTKSQRRAIPGLHPGRADFITAGLCLLSGVMQRFGCDEVLVSDRGVRFGLLYQRWPLATVL